MSTVESTTGEKVRTDYTEGSVWVAILTMGLPSMLGFLGQHVYALIDMFWVSRLPEGEGAVAAITFYNNMMFVFFSINSLVGPGSVAVCDQLRAVDKRRLTRALGRLSVSDLGRLRRVCVGF